MIRHSFKLPVKEVPVVGGTKSNEKWPYTGESGPGRKPQQQAPWWAGALKEKEEVTRRMGKLEYAQFLSKLDMKRGDIVIHYNNWQDKSTPCPDMDIGFFYHVEDIMELHGLVDYTKHDGPKCLLLRTVGRPASTGFWGPPSWWNVVPKESYPSKLIKFLESNNNDPTLL